MLGYCSAVQLAVTPTKHRSNMHDASHVMEVTCNLQLPADHLVDRSKLGMLRLRSMLCFFLTACDGLAAGVFACAGLDGLVGSMTSWRKSTEVVEIALRLYKNLTASSGELTHAGVTELELLLLELLSSSTAMHTAFKQVALQQQQQQLQPDQPAGPSSSAVCRAQPGPVAEAVESGDDCWMQEVFFVTDRNYNQAAHKAGKLPEAFGTDQQGCVRYGVATVRIPKVCCDQLCTVSPSSAQDRSKNDLCLHQHKIQARRFVPSSAQDTSKNDSCLYKHTCTLC
jgi:hypothetical protein